MAIILDLPRSLTEFELRFGSEDACAEYLAAVRWPDGFVCPGCGGRKAWQLESKPWTYECAGCGRQTSVTAGRYGRDINRYKLAYSRYNPG
jgi:hypothetical protein